MAVCFVYFLSQTDSRRPFLRAKCTNILAQQVHEALASFSEPTFMEVAPSNNEGGDDDGDNDDDDDDDNGGGDGDGPVSVPAEERSGEATIVIETEVSSLAFPCDIKFFFSVHGRCLGA